MYPKYTLSLNHFIQKGDPYEHVTVAIRIQRNYSFEVIVEDKQSYVRRPLMKNREKHTGERIFVWNLDERNVLEHSLSFRSITILNLPIEMIFVAVKSSILQMI